MQRVTAIILLIFNVLVFPSFSQLEFPEDKVSWSFSVEQSGNDATIIGKIKIIDHWHIGAVKMPKGSFGFPTSIEIKESPNYKLIGDLLEPKPISFFDEMADEQVAYHEGAIIFKQKIKIISEQDFVLSGVFSFQPCNDVKCLKDYSTTFKVKVNGSKNVNDVTEQKKIVSEFTKILNDEATHKDGSTYVLVNGKWYEVPKGNSVEFYKKYLLITKKNEK
jgi:hypothetical protein